ncbi:MAG: hypothetical protein FK730_15905 [Asgard group archaeon]|nr:hypothetical protein [Asgard group archaeon]
MSNRKNKVLIVFALMIITMNIFALTQVKGLRYGEQDESIITSSTSEIQPGNNGLTLMPQFNDSNLPSLSLWDLDINMTRRISLQNFGYINVTDTYFIQKNDNITLPIFRFAFPNEWSSKVVYISAHTMYDIDKGINQTKVFVEYENDEYTFYGLNLIPALINETIYKVIVHTTLLRPYEVTWKIVDQLMRNAIYMNFSLVPMLTVDLAKCTTSFEWDSECGYIEDSAIPGNASVGGASVIFENMNNIKAYNFSRIYDLGDTEYSYYGRVGCWMGHYPPAEAITYKRTIILENWYWAQVYDEILIKNYGAHPPNSDDLWDMLNRNLWNTWSLHWLYIWVDNTEESSFRAYDELGELGAPVTRDTPEWQKNRVNAYLRMPLNGGDQKTIYFEYKIKLENILKFEKTEYLLETVGMPTCDFHVREFELEIIFPLGARFQQITFGNAQIDYTTGTTGVFLNIGRRQTVSLSANNLTFSHDLSLKASYYMSDLSYFIQPLTLALIIFIACLLYIGVRVLRKDVLKKVILTPEVEEEIPLELIQSFVEQYEEKTALQTRISNLDENRRKKKIKAKEYDTQRKILESKMRELIKSLDSTKRDLKEIGRKYFDVIQKIEVAEEKRNSIERSIQDLRIRYIREKQISKDAYLRILRDYQNQIEKFERNIDREIINLRLLIEHESKNL